MAWRYRALADEFGAAPGCRAFSDRGRTKRIHGSATLPGTMQIVPNDERAN
jgi:hypothetical protein